LTNIARRAVPLQ